MTLKEQVLNELELNRGKSISGTALAEKLYVSRGAVWKAIKSLRNDGYEINAVTNKGYMLSENSNILSKAGIMPFLNDKTKNIVTLDIRKTVTSTNTVLKEIALNGGKQGYVLISEQQTAGKGRLGRSFYSPNDTGIYMSVLLRPKMTIEDSLLITTSTAVAVSKAIEKLCDKKARIKWVNDIFVDGRKVCGILTESSLDTESGRLEYAVVGIGVNISKPNDGFPDDIKNTAGGFLDNVKGNVRCRLIAEILNQLAEQMENLSSKYYLEEYKKRCFLIGKNITVIKPSGNKTAKAIGIDDNVRLIVEYDDKTVEHLSSGEVSINIDNLNQVNGYK